MTINTCQPIPNTLSSERPLVTIVVVPRERFSCTQQSLESVFAHTRLPYELIYVDGNSPAPVRRYLEQQADARGFRLLRTEYYLYPNHARNLGLAQVDTK
ncbi:MAG TPA: glycosyltransferase family 2 protein, partial [Elainellaceae cyanobacterium]